MSDDDEDLRMRSVALENAKSILRARERAERQLAAAKEALEKKTAELEQQREWFRVTLSSIGDAVITTDMAGRVSFLNPVAEAMTGWTSAEALGQPLETVFEIVNEDTRGRAENPVERVLREGVIVGLANHTALIGRHGVETAIEDSAAPIRAADGSVSGAVMVFHDVTQRRRAEQAAQREIRNRERAEEALRETDRRKDEFLATLAHELRNPLAPIRQAAVISSSADATEAQKRWSYGVIDRQVKLMSLLLDDLLDISRFSRGTLELRKQATELAGIVDAAVETARPAIDARRHALTLELPPEPVHFLADPVRLAQVLSNLLTNAAKYTDQEGQIRLRARATTDGVVITVTDTGIGISAEALPKIFQMFSQVEAARDRSEGGLGIGLALARAVVELHGGEIAAQSGGPGLGSDFTVRVPLIAAVSSGTGDASSNSAVRSTRQRKVLIADDNEDAAESLAILLRLDGHDIVVANDGIEALRTFLDFRPDVALLDIGMPGLDGYELARRLRQELPGNAFTLIALTGWGQDSDKEKAKVAGFDHHFTKPLEPDRLRALLKA